jgi:hypothetical protein
MAQIQMICKAIRLQKFHSCHGSSHKPQRGHILKKACQLEEDMVNAAAQNKENIAISEDAVTEGFPSELGRHSIKKA